MSRKSKFSYEAKLKAVKQYISGEASPASIAKVLGAGRTTLRQWVYAFKDQGPEALRPHKYNGYVYGLLFNFGMSIWGGWSSFLGYVAGSFLFDTYHCLGNFGFYFVLYKPLTLALNNYKRKAGISYD